MKLTKAAIASSILILSAGTAAYAGEAEDTVIAKVIEGYGGDRFADMKTVTFTETMYASGGAGQGNIQGFSPLGMQKKITMFDPEKKLGSDETYGRNENFVFHTRTTSTLDGIVAIDYTQGTYQAEASENYYQSMGPMTRSIDTMLAYELTRNSELAEVKGQENYLGRAHHLVTYNLPESPPLTLYVDDTSGHITRMQRVTPFGNLEYIFSNYASDGGIDYAQMFQFFIDGYMTSLAVREADFNSVSSRDFAMDRGLEEEPERIDGSEMTVDAIGDGLHLVGQGGAYSLFIDNGTDIIGMGGYAGLEGRFTAYQEAAGHTKPLATHIVTHHHQDHIQGIPEAYALGAKLILTPDSVEPVKALIEGPVLDSRFDVLEGDRDMGPVTLLSVSTSHADQNIMPYIKSVKAIFQADHYGSPYPNEVGTVNGNGRSMKRAIDRKTVDVEKLLSAHGRKVEDWDAFSEAAETSDSYACFKSRKICRD